MKKQLFIFMILLNGLTSTLQAEDLSYWNWTTLSTKIDDFKISLLVDNRYKDNADDHYFRFGSLKLAYPIHENWTAGINYSLYQSDVANEWKDGRRLEFELNPHTKFDNGVKLSMRNRIEFRDIEHKGSDNTRTRHRLSIFVPIETRFEAFKGIYASNEFFINLSDDENRWNENRFAPFGLRFAIGPKISLGVFYMQQMIRKTDSSNWTQTPAIGTSLIINF